MRSFARLLGSVFALLTALAGGDALAQAYPSRTVTLLVPYGRGEIISRLHVQGRVLSTDYREDGTLVTAMVHPARVEELKPFVA